MMSGQGKESPLDDQARSLLHQFKSDIESKLGKAFSTFNPVSYQTQVVAGVLHKFKVAVDDGKTIVASIEEKLPAEGGHKALKSATFE